MMYIGFIFYHILCISTKLRICIRKVCILDRIKKRIFGILALFAQCTNVIFRGLKESYKMKIAYNPYLILNDFHVLKTALK